MRKYVFTLILLCTGIHSMTAQVGVGTNTPSDASMLEVSSTIDGTNYKGFMPPRVATIANRDAIPATATDVGLMVFVQSTNCLQMWNGTAWEDVHCVTGTPAAASDLFISEYVEGTGNNKVIEVANFTGAPVTLSGYQLVQFSNGSTTPTVTYTFGGVSLADGDVYVVAHPAYGGSSDDTFGWGFNGDDVIELQTTAAVVIDAFGTRGTASIFAQNVTMRKNAGTGPIAAYSAANYTVFPVDTFSDLGSHTY